MMSTSRRTTFALLASCPWSIHPVLLCLTLLVNADLLVSRWGFFNTPNIWSLCSLQYFMIRLYFKEPVRSYCKMPFFIGLVVRSLWSLEITQSQPRLLPRGWASSQRATRQWRTLQLVSTYLSARWTPGKECSQTTKWAHSKLCAPCQRFDVCVQGRQGLCDPWYRPERSNSGPDGRHPEESHRDRLCQDLPTAEAHHCRGLPEAGWCIMRLF